MACADLAIALLAAGRSSRFGSDKLEHPVGGTMLGVRAARAVSTLGFGHRFAVTSASRPVVSAALTAEGFAIVDNDAPSAGLSRSISLAVAAAAQTDATALLICLADMPLVTADHLTALVAAWRTGGGVVASSNEGVATPPAIFPRSIWPILERLEGDRGARDIIAAARLIPASAHALRDIDRLSDVPATPVLGAVLAGGNSRRFGSDKAQALLDGRPFIEHAIDALAAQCDAVVVVGRDMAGIACVPDRPGPGLGPLGGIAGALGFAVANGFATVLTCGVDSVGLPDLLALRLSPAPAFVADQPVVGLWRAGDLATLDALLAGDSNRAVRHFGDRVGARALAIDGLANVNTPDALAELALRRR